MAERAVQQVALLQGHAKQYQLKRNKRNNGGGSQMGINNLNVNQISVSDNYGPMETRNNNGQISTQSVN